MACLQRYGVECDAPGGSGAAVVGGLCHLSPLSPQEWKQQQEGWVTQIDRWRGTQPVAIPGRRGPTLVSFELRETVRELTGTWKTRDCSEGAQLIVLSQLVDSGADGEGPTSGGFWS